ncbi:SDR family NAD(P)-dependent oxidoreductase [Iodidimonas sp. SYSU 1G8]|uniref:SDR family NAD(P)-dependent oxidoreductase n=1 Tax=Iodidimonas sp. SYSU 1G8 TaxID=3133967 RepID=UPI0031FEAB31
MDVNGVAAIITGGASGLGRATAEALIAKGAKVTIFDVNEAAGEAAAKEIGAVFAKVDVTSEESVIAGLDKGKAAHGQDARILINCAGVADAGKTVAKGEPHSLAVYTKVININLIGTFNCIRLAAARMTQMEPLTDGERGVIVNTASVAAFEGQIGQVAYASSKGGVVSMTLTVARDLSRDGVRCCTIAPGLFITPMLKGLPQAVQDSLGATVPFPSRLGDPSEYAKTVLFICDNPMVNGETIRLDGALRMAPK